MNRGDIRSAVKLRLAIPSTGDGLLTDAVLDSHINRSLATISGAREWPWLLTTNDLTFVSGQASLPQDFIRARSLIYNTLPVQWVQLEDFLDPDRFFVPYGWTIVGNTAKLAPTPTSTITATLYYYRAEPELHSDFSIPLIPSLHHELIVAHAAYLACLTRQDEQRASVNFADYNMMLNNMRDDLKQNTGRRIRFERGRQYAVWS